MYKLGIDVGGTNTDAVLVDENRAVVADIKYPTSADIYDGILGAMRTVLEVSGVDPSQIHQAMLGTTQCTNAIVERKNLAPIGILRIGAPATTGIRPWWTGRRTFRRWPWAAPSSEAALNMTAGSWPPWIPGQRRRFLKR